MNRSTCFICYAWGSEERYKQLDFFRSKIIDESNNQLEVILDRHSYADNQDFNELRKRIKTYDLIIVICTPDFKKITQDPDSNKNKDREVLKEYHIVKQIYDENPSSVFPVIFEEDKEKSLLDIFKNKNARIYKVFEISKNNNGKLYIPNQRKKDYKVFIGKIINTAIYNKLDKSEEYENSKIALDKLFSLTDNVKIPDSCLVKSDLYYDILGQSYYFIVGRKGSGKSTFINNFREMDKSYFDKKYKTMIPLSAEAFQHEDAYSTLIEGHKEDLSLVTQYDILVLFWKIYFILHSIVTIRAEIENHNITEKDSRFKIFDSVTKKLKQKIGLKINQRRYRPINSDVVPKSIFQAAIEMIDEQFRIALKDCSEDELIATSFSSRFNAEEIINKNFGEKNIQLFIEALSRCEKKILISLDGFDTHSEDFRMTTNSMSKDCKEFGNRNEYERFFFRTLVEVVTNFKTHRYNDRLLDAFSKYIDFCIVLPKDRYDQIISNDRDSFKKKFGSMAWSAYELLELLTKRIEYLISCKSKNKIPNYSSDCFERMEKALDFFPGLPKTITMNVQENKINISLFNYILRSSFWRPRDVISNLSCLLARFIHISGDNNEWILDTDIKLSEDEIKLAIKDNAKRIIQEEFIDENKYVFRNINDVLKEFHGLNEQMSVKEFTELLSNIRFDTSYSYDMGKVENKLLVLYQMGVIGFKYTKKFADNMHYLHHICFVFNAGMHPFDDFIKHKTKTEDEVFIIFNPIFAREFMLNFNTKELLGNWTNEYIYNNNKMKNLIKSL